MNARLDAYDRHCIELIAEHGWMVQGVFPTRDDPGEAFAYTVGLTVAGLSELVIAGLPVDTMQPLLNAAAKHALGHEMRPGDLLEGIASVPLRIASAPAAQVNMARHLYPDRMVTALQLIWPDKDGAFPGDPGWSLGGMQPVYA